MAETNPNVLSNALVVQLIDKVDKLLGVAIEIREATVKKAIASGASAYDSAPIPQASDQAPPPGARPHFFGTPSPQYPQGPPPQQEVQTVPDLPAEQAHYPHAR